MWGGILSCGPDGIRPARWFRTGAQLVKLPHFLILLPLLTSAASLNYATYLGGSGDDLGAAVALDSSGNIVVAGYTRSSDFPTTPGAYQTAVNGSTYAGFVEKLDPTGTHLVFATYLSAS